MKAFGILNYSAQDVFHIFVKNAKRDFPNFNEDNAIGCKIKKNIASRGPTPVECTVEITSYIKNEKYQITTSTDYTKCISTYMFKEQKDGTTKLIFEEEQSAEKFISYMSLYLQRFMARRNFKVRYKNIVEGINNELKTHFDNIERSKPKDKVLSE